MKNKSLILKIIQIVIANVLLNLVLVKGLTSKHSKNGMKINVAVNVLETNFTSAEIFK